MAEVVLFAVKSCMLAVHTGGKQNSILQTISALAVRARFGATQFVLVSCWQVEKQGPSQIICC